MLKNHWHRTVSCLSVLLALLLLLPYGLPAQAAETIILEIPLLFPIEYTSESASPTAEETAVAQSAIRAIFQTAYDAFLTDHPLEFVWIDIASSRVSATSTSSAGMGHAYRWTILTLKNQIVAHENFFDPQGMTEQLKEIVKSFTPTGETRYEKLLSIHDFVCSSTVYDASGPYAYGAYGALVDGRSVCEGYAEAFKILCDQNDIPCILVSGIGITSSGEESHMWNYVRMEDDRWYAVDATWDDGKKIQRNYFLVGSDTIVNSKSGKPFSESHKPNGDISDTDLKTFAYPTLSTTAYTPSATAIADAGADTHWFYDQLTDEQKNFYNHLLTVKPPKGEFPPETTTATTTKKPTSTTLPITTAVDTTTEAPLLRPDTTTTSPPATSTEDVTTEDILTPETTTPSPDTATPSVTTSDDTAVPFTSGTELGNPETVPATTPTSTGSITMKPPGTENDLVYKTAESTDAIDVPFLSETEVASPLDNKESSVTDRLTVTPDTQKATDKNHTSVSYILRVAGIVLTLFTIFALIVRIIVRFDRMQS